MCEYSTRKCHKACSVLERALYTVQHFSALAIGRRLKAYLT
jgi:hypothetical protein